MDKPLWGLRVQRVVLSSIPVGACACGAEGRMASIGLPALGAKGCAERLHRFARGAADWRSGPQWTILSVLCPVHPFPLRGTSPQGETRDMERKTGRHIHQAPFRRFPPLVAAPPPSPHFVVGLWVLSHGAMSLQESIETYSVPRMGWQGNTIRKEAKRPENRVTRFPMEKVRRSPDRGVARMTSLEFMQGSGTSPFPPTGIYYRLAHKCLVPRFFAYGSE